MMLPPHPGVLDTLVGERQSRLRAAAPAGRADVTPRWRVRVGHALIVAGSFVSGERVEPARPPTPARA